MRETHLSGLDLNLLVPLQVLLRERSVTRAGAHLGLSQPAVSRTLGRLRDVFGDPLLVRAGRRMVLTPRGEALIEPLDQVLEQVGGLVHPTEFDPVQWSGRFRIAMTDYAAQQLLPRLMATLRARAPHAAIDIEPWRSDSRSRLEEGDLDLAVHPVAEGPAGLVRRALWTESFSCVVRREHPAAGGLDLESYLAAGHVLVTVTGVGRGHVNDALADRGLHRHIALTVPSFLAAAWAVRESDLVLTLPDRLARSLAEPLGLAVLTPPLELSGFTLHLVWHERRHRAPAHAWMRTRVVEAAAL